MTQRNLFDNSNERGTLAEAREAVRDARWSQEGITCPCCFQYVKVYKWNIIRTMAVALVEMVR